MNTPLITLSKSSKNLTAVQLPNVTLYFSYETCIGFKDKPTNTAVVSENLWGSQTGSHINLVNPDFSARLPRSEFAVALATVLSAS